MNYYVLCNCEHAVKNPMVCSCNLKECEIERSDFEQCKLFDCEKYKIKFYIDEEKWDGDPDDGLQNGEMLPVFSPRLIKALIDSDVRGIQYIPAIVEHYDKRKIEGFCIANVMAYVVDALNIKESILMKDDYHRGKYGFIWTYAVYENKIRGFDIFRIKLNKQFSKQYSDIIVSEKFKNIFTQNKFTGYAFKKVILTE